MKKNKYIIFGIIIIALLIIFPINIFALEIDNITLFGDVGFCTKSAKIIKLIGRIFKIFKILIPIILIVVSSIDLFKAVTAQKEDEIKKATGNLAKRIILSVAIFLLPTLIYWLFNGLSGFMTGEVGAEYKVCAECIVNGQGCP